MLSPSSVRCGLLAGASPRALARGGGAAGRAAGVGTVRGQWHRGQQILAASGLVVLLLAAARGSTITISADGSDERDAVTALVALVRSGFGEDACGD